MRVKRDQDHERERERNKEAEWGIYRLKHLREVQTIALQFTHLTLILIQSMKKN